MAQFNSLPSKVVTLIIDHVKQQSTRSVYKFLFINKQFYKATMPILWHYVMIRKTFKFLRCLALADPTVGEYIRTIHFSDNFEWGDIDFLILANHASLLEECILPFATRIPKECIQQFPLLCPNLTALHLGNPFEHQQCLNCMKGGGYRKHEALQYDRHSNLNLDTDALVEGLVPYPSLLEKLSIVHPPPQMMAAMEAQPQTFLADLTQFNRLTHLRLYFVPNTLLQCVFESTMTRWPDLVHFAIAGDLPYHSDDSAPFMGPFLQAHRDLQALHFIHCPLREHSIKVIAAIRLPSLMDVTVTDMKLRPPPDAKSFMELIESTPRLNYVTMNGKKMGLKELRPYRRRY